MNLLGQCRRVNCDHEKYSFGSHPISPRRLWSYFGFKYSGVDSHCCMDLNPYPHTYQLPNDPVYDNPYHNAFSDANSQPFLHSNTHKHRHSYSLDHTISFFNCYRNPTSEHRSYFTAHRCSFHLQWEP